MQTTRRLLPAVLVLGLVIAGALGYIAGRVEAERSTTTVVERATETLTITTSLRLTATITQPTLRPPPNGYAIVFLGGAVVHAEVPQSPEEFWRGLSGRERLEDGFGMLFVFEQEGLHSFWMYGMRFSIDIIWIDSGGRVVHIVEGAEPCAGGECVIYAPPAPARFVLEVPAGFASRHGVSLGSFAEIYLEATEG